MLAAAERPAIMAGTGLYWARGEGELRALAEALGIPVFLNGMGRGCLPADHELAFSRARGTGLKGADVALVVGVPLDFRLGFGGTFGEETKLIRLDSAPNRLERDRQPEVDAGRRHRRDARRRSREAAVGEGADPSGPRPGSSSCARRRPRSALPSRATSTTIAPRCTRCASTGSCARCSTATRS